jgi:hypothetical protein
VQTLTLAVLSTSNATGERLWGGHLESTFARLLVMCLLSLYFCFSKSVEKKSDTQHLENIIMFVKKNINEIINQGLSTTEPLPNFSEVLA